MNKRCFQTMGEVAVLNRVVLAFALVIVPLASAAAPPPEPKSTNPDPYSPDRKQLTLDEDQARRFVDDFGRCTASRQPRKAAAALALQYGSARQGKAVQELATDELDCWGAFSGAGSFSSDLRPLTAGMAEYFVTNPKKIGDVRVRQPQAFIYAEPAGVEIFGECIVKQNAAAVETLVRSPVASDAETAATDALIPALEQCVTRGQTLELDRTALRQLLAVRLYKHIAIPPPQAGPAAAQSQH